MSECGGAQGGGLGALLAGGHAPALRLKLCFRDALELAEGRGEAAAVLATCDDLLAEHEATVAAFRERWFAGNRHSEIEVALSKFDHAAAVLRTIHAWLRTHHAGTPLPALPAYQPLPQEDLGHIWTAEDEEFAVMT